MGKKVKEFLKESLEIFKAFFKRLKIEDDLLKVPSSLRKTGNWLETFNFITTIVSMIFSFLRYCFIYALQK